MTALPRDSIALRLMPRLGKTWRRWTNRSDLRRILRLVPDILTALPPDLPAPDTWQVQRVEWTLTDTVVITVGPAGQPPTVVLKLPRTESGLDSLRLQEGALARLAAESRLQDWLKRTPEVLAAIDLDGQMCFVERALPGREGRLLLHDHAAEWRLHSEAAAAIRELHQLTASQVVVDREFLDRRVEHPLHLIMSVVTGRPGEGRYQVLLAEIGRDLSAALKGRTLTTGWVHGDFWASNLLGTGDGALTGIVDWDRASAGELPVLDVLHLLVQRRKLLARQSDSGGAIAALLSGEGWTSEERALLDAPLYLIPGMQYEDRRVLFLYWLRSMAVYLEQDPARASHESWIHHNIEVVLRCL